MMKNGPLNSEITKVLADLGHTDTVVIADCGLPIPVGVRKIDLAVTIGKPEFLEILELMETHMEIERVTVAAEMESANGAMLERIRQTHSSITSVSHEEFKVQTKSAKVIIRTGEATPYANIILHAGVIF